MSDTSGACPSCEGEGAYRDGFPEAGGPEKCSGCNGTGRAAAESPDDNPGITPAELAEIHEALNDRCRPRTHWHGCHLDPRHRDCLARRLVAEVERLRGLVAAKAAAYRQRADLCLGVAHDPYFSFRSSGEKLAEVANDLDRILEDRP